MDFTLKNYEQLLRALLIRKYNFISFYDYISIKRLVINNPDINKLASKSSPLCILRHDVDRKPLNAIDTAKIENELGLHGSYYFRMVPESFDKKIVGQILKLGHEIGYHYEDIDSVLRSQKSEARCRQNGGIDIESLIDLAYSSFLKNLEIFRRDFHIKTICMHGSPLSKYDNKMIWGKYDYKKLDILGEPYFDINWNEFGYLTDTGRKWNGADSSVRDKVESKFKFNFKSTKDIIDNIDLLPEKIMITVHPQRWNNKLVPWLKEYISQNTKNLIKKYFFVSHKN